MAPPAAARRAPGAGPPGTDGGFAGAKTFGGYKPVGKIGEGTFSDILKTPSLRDGKYNACKHVKQHFESMEQVTNLRETEALRRLSLHPNILMLHKLFCNYTGSLALICELMDMNIYKLIKGRRKPLSEKKTKPKNYRYKLCKSLDYIHLNGIFHRDVKPENILMKQNTLKLGDFGSCRSIYSKQPQEYISTRWYRAPECLLTNGCYSYKTGMWSAGCVFYEIASFQPLFPGSNKLDQISKIHHVIGTAANKKLTKFKQSRIATFFPFKKGKGIPLLVHSLSLRGFSLPYAMIKYDPDERIAAHQALQHPYFQELWAADTQALAKHKKLRLLENISGQVPPHLWQISKESQRQHSPRKVQEKTKLHGPHCGELPKLNLSGSTLESIRLLYSVTST
ncbi:LOW QUALITY PROTEIN: MAPK/MAK/MRK overlapping kinase [Cariama cristata]